jgi:hypothetical protein
MRRDGSILVDVGQAAAAGAAYGDAGTLLRWHRRLVVRLVADLASGDRERDRRR